MAKLALDLSQFQSAGVYTIEVDLSERIVVDTQALRLLPGFSKVGPFNAPVFIRSTRDRFRFFGDVDKKLERKGSFFHRSIDTCLLQSPVFAINLLNVDGDPATSADKVDLIGFSIDSSISNENITNDLYVNFFNRQRFWRADTEYLQGVVNNKYNASSNEDAPLLQIANVGTKNISFIVRKPVGLQGFNMTAREWYGNEDNIPFDWIRPTDQMKNFFVQIIAIEGNWTNYSDLSTDPFFKDYFNSNGFKPSKLNQFINLPQTNLIGSWTGTIIPEFRDQTGSNQYIEDIVNGGVQITGVLLNVNKDALDNLTWDETEGWSGSTYLVDLLGHNLIDYYEDGGTDTIEKDFLSYDINTDSSTLHNTIDISLNSDNGKIFYLTDEDDASNITIGTLVKKDDQNGEIPAGVTYVTAKTFDNEVSTGTSPDGLYEIETAEAIYDYQNDASTIIVQKPIDHQDIATHYKLFKLKGLKIRSNHLPGYDSDGESNREKGVEKVYGMLDDPGILRGLTNKDMIQYRYIVDTMAYGLRSQLGGKRYLSKLAKKRGKTTALISAPSMRQFASSQNPYFTDIFVPGVDPVPIFDTRWIPEGGNPDMPRDFRFTFPTEDNGSQYMGVFGPYLRYMEGNKTFYVPPAADVSNTYVRKFLGGDPYAIVANRNGILSNAAIAGVEYMIDQQDRDYLEPFGYNSIIERASTAEIMIYSNRTSFQTMASDFNYLHVRELLNTIELQVEEVLKNYVFAYNNPVTRLNIINAVTPILESVKDAGALYDYEVVMDESNNTPEIIQEAFGIIDIGVWVTKGMEKIVSRITVNSLDEGGSGGTTTV